MCINFPKSSSSRSSRFPKSPEELKSELKKFMTAHGWGIEKADLTTGAATSESYSQQLPSPGEEIPREEPSHSNGEVVFEGPNLARPRDQRNHSPFSEEEQ